MGRAVDEDGLTSKRAAFVREYLKDFNGTQAAIRAGYSPKSAKQTAIEVLSDPTVRAAVDRGKAEIRKKDSDLREQVLAELRRLAFSEMTDLGNWDADGNKVKDSTQLSKKARRSIKTIEFRKDGTVKFGLHSKTNALALLAKYTGLDKPETETPAGTPTVQVVISYPTNDRGPAKE